MSEWRLARKLQFTVSPVGRDGTDGKSDASVQSRRATGRMASRTSFEPKPPPLGAILHCSETPTSPCVISFPCKVFPSTLHHHPLPASAGWLKFLVFVTHSLTPESRRQIPNWWWAQQEVDATDQTWVGSTDESGGAKHWYRNSDWPSFCLAVQVTQNCPLFSWHASWHFNVSPFQKPAPECGSKATRWNVCNLVPPIRTLTTSNPPRTWLYWDREEGERIREETFWFTACANPSASPFSRNCHPLTSNNFSKDKSWKKIENFLFISTRQLTGKAKVGIGWFVRIGKPYFVVNEL